MIYLFSQISSPLGQLRLVGKNHKLVAILWEHDSPKRVPLGAMQAAPNDPGLRQAARQLEEYFLGKRRTFDLDMAFKGTAFQQAV